MLVLLKAPLLTYIFNLPFFPHRFFESIGFWIISGIAAYLVYLQNRRFHWLDEERAVSKSILGIICLFFFPYFFILNYFAYQNFHTTSRDFAHYLQIVWKLSEGLYPFSTIFNNHYLGDHWSLILLPLAYIYKVFPHPLTMLALNILTFLFGSLFLYHIANHFLKNSWLSFAVFVSLILNPYVHSALIARFEPDIYSYFFIAGAVFYLLKNRPLYFLFFYILAINCKEDIPLYFVFIGIWQIVFLKQRLRGFLLALFSTGFFLWVLKIAIPHFTTLAVLENLQRYQYLGNTFTEAIANIFLHPHILLQQISFREIITNFFLVLAPVLPFPFLGGTAFLLSLPPLAVKLLSSRIDMVEFGKHHIWHPLFFIYLSAILGIGKAVYSRMNEKPLLRQRAINLIAILLILAGFFNTFCYSSYCLLNRNNFNWDEILPDATTTTWQKIDSIIPKEANILGDIHLLGHWPNRIHLYELNRYTDFQKNLPEIMQSIDYCIINLEEPLPERESLVVFYCQSQNWPEMLKEHNIVLYRNHHSR